MGGRSPNAIPRRRDASADQQTGLLPMKAQLLMLSAAGLLLAAPAAFATPDREVQAFVDHAQSAAQARLLAAGVGEPAAITKVRGVIGADGRLSGVHVVGASGSRETDFAVERALRRLD